MYDGLNERIGLEGIYASNPGETIEIPLYKDVMEAIHEVNMNAIAVSGVVTIESKLLIYIVYCLSVQL
jgi:hypothetical protein